MHIHGLFGFCFQGEAHRFLEGHARVAALAPCRWGRAPGPRGVSHGHGASAEGWGTPPGGRKHGREDEATAPTPWISMDPHGPWPSHAIDAMDAMDAIEKVTGNSVNIRKLEMLMDPIGDQQGWEGCRSFPLKPLQEADSAFRRCEPQLRVCHLPAKTGGGAGLQAAVSRWQRYLGANVSNKTGSCPLPALANSLQVFELPSSLKWRSQNKLQKQVHQVPSIF